MEKGSTTKTFERIYKDNIDPLFRFVHYRVADREESIDIVEESFVRLWKEMEVKGVKEHRALLYKIARNLVIDWYRKEKAVSLPSFQNEDALDTEISIDMFASDIPHAELLLESKMVIEAISKLSPLHREAVYLRYVEELTPSEIAEIVGESPNNISVRINRGKVELKAILKLV